MDSFPLATDNVQRALEDIADATLVFDNHAHPFWIDSTSTAPTPLVHVLTEAPPPSHLSNPELPPDLPPPAPLARSTLAFRRSLMDLRHLLQIQNPAASPPSPTTNHHMDQPRSPVDTAAPFAQPCQLEQSIDAARAHLGIWGLAKRCFEGAGVAAVLLDDGLTPPNPNSRPATCHEFVRNVRVVARRLLRLETEAEDVIRSLIPSIHAAQTGSGNPMTPGNLMRARAFKEAFWARLNPLPDGVAGFKSIVAYRSGLAVSLHWTEEHLEHGLAQVMSNPANIKLREPVVLHFIVKWGMEAARLHALPIQFHCGFGDRDLELHKADPSLLKEVLETYQDVKVVLLHAAWPFVRQAAYLASVYQKVYVDLGLAIPLLSIRGMATVVEEALHLAPMTKLMYSSDAHSVPDVFYLAAKWGRRVIAGGVAACVTAGDLTLAEGKQAVRLILAENAMRVYGMDLDA